ncbi:hypothetical protein BBJ28_00002649 [Nothophytophthora sp. Chile5]|nr:hypothetical protein BBJ28_00002649 [Nothophytophthora sp. Chile5]
MSLSRSLGAFGFVLALLPSVVSAACAAGSSTLTTQDCTACDSYALCLGYTSSADCSGSDCVTDGDCTYECMSVDESSTTLIVLVVFGDYESSEEAAARAAGSYDDAELSSSGYADYTSTWPWVENDQVTAIDTIDLSSSVTTLYVPSFSGNSSMEYPKSKVANVSFGADLISSATTVTQVVLHNLNLENQVDSLPTLLPSSVEVLNIGNSLLTSFPTVLSSMTSLHDLYVRLLDLLAVIPSANLCLLNVLKQKRRQNDLESFTAVFPNLESFYLTGNSFASMSFTQDEIDFLDNLTVLGLEASDFSVDLHCDESKKTVVHDVTVCLSKVSYAGTGSDSTTSSSSGNEDQATSSSETSRSSGSDSSTTTTSSDSSSSVSVGVSVGVIVGIACAVVVVLVIGVGLFMYCRRQKKNKRDKLSETNEFVGAYHPSIVNAGQMRRQTYADLTLASEVSMGIPTTTGGASMGIPATWRSSGGTQSGAFLSLWNDPDLLSLQVRAEDVEDMKQLGSGAYAVVWLVRYRNTQLLASKRLRPEIRSKKRTSVFVEEIKLIANFDHPNLVSFIGAAWTIESDLQMLLEYMEGGDLREYLSNPEAPRAWSPAKFDIAIGIIEALVYLHSFVPPLVHRDLKSRNVLLSSDLKAKLSDFGTSRFRSLDSTMTAGVGTGRWLAPEVITGDSNYGPAVDVYSFGVLLTELDTHEIPYSKESGSNGQKLSDMAILHQVATARLRPKVGETCAPALRQLVKMCLVQEPALRPTAPAIAYELRMMRKDLVIFV